MSIEHRHMQSKYRIVRTQGYGMRAFNVPPRQYHFVLRALWRKLPIAARMFVFKMTSPQDNTLCSHPEDHARILKRCPYLSVPFSIIRWFWGAVVHDDEWVESSPLCLEDSVTSLTTVQGWLCRAAVCARWLIRCEYISFQRVDATTAILQR